MKSSRQLVNNDISTCGKGQAFKSTVQPKSRISVSSSTPKASPAASTRKFPFSSPEKPAFHRNRKVKNNWVTLNRTPCMQESLKHFFSLEGQKVPFIIHRWMDSGSTYLVFHNLMLFFRPHSRSVQVLKQNNIFRDRNKQQNFV